jgi:hypothetical protein
MESLRVCKKGSERTESNIGKTKIKRCSYELSAAKENGKFPCAVCLKGVGSNSIC